jgi:hypothetical protein
MYTGFCILNPVYMYMYVFFFFAAEIYWEYRTQNTVYMYIYVFFFLFPETTENTEPSIHVHLCFLLSASWKYWEYRTQHTCASIFSSICFQRKQKEENIDVHVYWVLYSQFSLETERRKHRCTCILAVYMYIYVFLFLFPENTENTEPSIHVHLCFLLSVSRQYWEYRTQYTCTSMILGSIFSVFSGNRKKKT